MCPHHASTSGSAGIAPDHPRAEIGEFPHVFRRARVMRANADAFRSEAERQGDVERLESAHLSIEPAVCIRPVRIGPAQARAQLLDAEPLQPADGALEPWILE